MNTNPKLYNAVLKKDLQLSPQLLNLVDDQTQDMNMQVITRGWVADTIEIMKDTEEYDENVVTELAELAKLMIQKRIQVIIL